MTRTALLTSAVLGIAFAVSCMYSQQARVESKQPAAESKAHGGGRVVDDGVWSPLGSLRERNDMSGRLSMSRTIQAVLHPSALVGSVPESCPAGMVGVSGEYCPNVVQRCLRWLEAEGRYAFYRCADYASPAKCVGKRRPMHFCIDRDEYIPPNEALPAANQSWTHARDVCASQGKRVCLESEWQFACEGEEMRPYPYGFQRDSQICNADRVDIYRPDGLLRDLREGRGGHPGCVSPFGVHHLAGNLEEWTTIDGSKPSRPAMKGAYWQPSRNHCRANQTSHDRYYHGVETGFRCCSDVT